MTLESDSDARMDMRIILHAVGARWLRIVLVTMLLMAAAYAVLLFMPKLYESSASILVESRDSIYLRAANATQPSNSATTEAGLISSQMELIKSRDTLLPVIKAEHLADVPEFNGSKKSFFSGLTRFLGKISPEATTDVVLANLARRLTVIRERDSSIITILVRSEDPELAASLANAIAQAGVTRRADLTLSDTADASERLKSQIDVLRKRVNDAEDKVANFKVKNDLFTGTNNTSLLDQQLSGVATQITDAQQRQSTAESRANLIRGLLKAGQPIDGVSDVQNSATIQQLSQQKATLQAQRAQLLATLLPNHPSVRAVVAQIAEVNRQISAEGRRVAGALEAEAKVEASLATSLKTELTRLKSSSATATRQSVTLDELNREAKAERDLLESYLGRYRDATSRTKANATLPDMRVVTLAVPGDAPVSPRTGFVLGAIGFVALAVQLGSVVMGELASGRALVSPETVSVPVPEPAGQSGPQPMAARTDENFEETESLEETKGFEETENLGEFDLRNEDNSPERRSLRTWFTGHAKSVGGALSAYEPPATTHQTSDTPSSGADETASDDPFATDSATTNPALEGAGEEKDAPALPAVVESEGVPSDAKPFRITNPRDFDNLSADLALGRAHVVILAGLDEETGAELMAERLVADALQRGLSAAHIDAGSARLGDEPGITDLSAGEAGFGDIVHKAGIEGLAHVGWGQLLKIDTQSSRPLTLIEALSDIYEAVVVQVGAIGNPDAEAVLKCFAPAECRLILVSDGEPDLDVADSARATAEAMGYELVQIIAAPSRQSDVA